MNQFPQQNNHNNATQLLLLLQNRKENKQANRQQQPGNNENDNEEIECSMWNVEVMVLAICCDPLSFVDCATPGLLEYMSLK